MLISHKHKFVTIDIPKTGTRSFRESLSPCNIIDVHGVANEQAQFYQHDKAPRIKRQFSKEGWSWDDYYKFTIVRNPWSRYFSFYKYFKTYADKYKRRDPSINWGPAEINQGKYCEQLFDSSDDQKVLHDIIINHDAQHLYYCEPNGSLMVDHVAEFNDIHDEYKKFCQHVSVHAPPLAHGNKSVSSLNMSDVYNQHLIDMVTTKEAHVIKLKGYSI